MISLLPGYQGLCGSQKYTFTFVATVKLLCLAIPSPWPQVNERRSDAGSLQTCRPSAATTVDLDAPAVLNAIEYVVLDRNVVRTYVYVDPVIVVLII